jgi:hypothetical protein
MRLSEAVSEIDRINKLIKKEKQRHESEMKSLDNARLAARRIVEASTAGLDSDKIQLAETVIYAQGNYGHGDDFAAVKEAISDIANGCKNLRVEYFGTKNYAHWFHQGTQHGYGYGPSHGSVVFSIGLLPEARRRDLTPDEADAAIYYLSNIGKVFKAREAAKEQTA